MLKLVLALYVYFGTLEAPSDLWTEIMVPSAVADSWGSTRECLFVSTRIHNLCPSSVHGGIWC